MRPRVGLARIWQETNGFSQKPTTLDDFRRMELLDGRAFAVTLAARADEAGGAAAVLRSGGAEVVPLVAAAAWPGGPAEAALCSGLAARLEAALRAAGPLDGLLLSMHGAMSGVGLPDLEGHLMGRVRAAVGPDMPVVLTLDHHANLTAAMIASVDALTAYRACPHTDMHQTGARGAALLLDILDGGARPVMAWRKIPMVTPCERFMTAEGPMRRLFDAARAAEGRSGIRDVSVFPVQPWLDVPEFGWSVAVVAEPGQTDRAEAEARALADLAWTMRAEFTTPKWTAADAVARALASPRGPVVLADGADATNGGSPGDSTELLAAFLAAVPQAPVLLTLVDPDAVAAAHSAGTGGEFEARVGAGWSTQHHRPVHLRGRVGRLCTDGRVTVGGHISGTVDMGRMAVIEIGAIRLLLSEAPGPGHDPAVYRHAGLDPEGAQAFVVKSTVGHLGICGPFMAESLPVECAGPSPSRLERLGYAAAGRPLYPLDADMRWSAP